MSGEVAHSEGFAVMETMCSIPAITAEDTNFDFYL